MTSNGSLNGQWIGRFGGTTPGAIVINIDELESTYEGAAYLFNDDPELPGTAVGFTVPDKKNAFEVRSNHLLALDPKSKEPVPLDKIRPEWNFSRYADAKGSLDGDKFQLSWQTDTGIRGDCILDRSHAGPLPTLRQKR